ncbi:MAG: hypothetical protein K2M36_05860, partial [Clostridia bacterium]|nr:hypothetical protein [Clostridia bacterium]
MIQPVVFIGDSLTARCELYKVYNKFLCINMGISGDTLENYLSVYKREIFNYPRAIVFLMGINDVVFHSADSHTLKGVYESLFTKFKEDFNGMPILIQSLYPVCLSFQEELQLPADINATIVDINKMLAGLCEKYGFTYVDVHSALLKDGELNIEYASDRIHVNEKCYAIISDIVTRALNQAFTKNVIDIKFKGEYPACALSNFYPHTFVFDGVTCASMEGFLQSLKYNSRSKQKEICMLTGFKAKRAGKFKFRWKRTHYVYWMGRRYDRRTRYFQWLIQ